MRNFPTSEIGLDQPIAFEPIGRIAKFRVERANAKSEKR
jgi:hypothetical protein